MSVVLVVEVASRGLDRRAGPLELRALGLDLFAFQELSTSLLGGDHEAAIFIYPFDGGIMTTLRDDDSSIVTHGLIGDRPESRSDASERPLVTRAWWRTWAIPVAAVVIYFLGYYIWPNYITLDPDKARILLRDEFAPHYAILVMHIVFGTVALVTLCLQIWPWLRKGYPAVHRISGRIYVFAGVIPNTLMIYALQGLYWGQNGNVGRALFTTLWFSSVLWNTLWLATTMLGFRAARQRRFTEHRRWMIRSFALGIAILWTRPTFTVPRSAVDLDVLQTVQTVIGWVPWILTLAVAELWLFWTARRPVALRA